MYLTKFDFWEVLGYLPSSSYDIFEIERKYSKLKNTSDLCAGTERRAKEAQLEYEKLQEKIAMNSLSFKELTSLGEIGFGLPEFKQLRYLAEVGRHSGIADEFAVKKFFDDLQDHFYDYVLLEKIVAELKAERAKLSVRDSSTQSSDMFQDFKKTFSKSESNVDTKKIFDTDKGVGSTTGEIDTTPLPADSVVESNPIEKTRCG
jgi:hypothetical protein